MISFLAQLVNALEPEESKEARDAPVQSKQKIELGIANRFKRTQDGYGPYNAKSP